MSGLRIMLRISSVNYAFNIVEILQHKFVHMGLRPYLVK